VLRQTLQTTWARAAVATLVLALHLTAFSVFAAARFSQPWNRAPGEAPALATPTATSPAHWNRLAVSRWDSQHYLNLALRGYAQCPEETRRTGKLPSPPTMLCDLAFYPGYPLAGRLLSLGGLVPIDYALLGLSLVSSWIFFFLWTGKEVVEALGLRATYVALAAQALFTTGFAVVTIQTEPLLLAATLGTFVLARRGHLLPAALVAGVATGARITGVSVGLAFAAMLAVEGFASRPQPLAWWARRAGLAALGFWGIGLTMAYHGVVLRDPLAYVHAHEMSFGHSPSLTALLAPKVPWLLGSLISPLHEGMWLAAALLWLALGHREALGAFPAPSRAYWYTLTAATLGVAMLGSVSRSFIGMNRYLLVAPPLFFAIGKVLERRRLALAGWLALCAWHYWNVDLCYYIGDAGAETVRRCGGVLCSGG
jgi:hypothetical protein